MTACYCERCTDSPRPTYTRKYMLECEARGVLRKVRALRRIYCNGVWKARGEAAAMELIAEIVRQGGSDAIKLRNETRGGLVA